MSVRLQHQQAGAGGWHKGWGCFPVGPFQPCSPSQDLHHASECWHAPVPCLRWHQCHLVWYQPEHAGALGHDVSHLPAWPFNLPATCLTLVRVKLLAAMDQSQKCLSKASHRHIHARHARHTLAILMACQACVPGMYVPVRSFGQTVKA